MKYKQTSLKAVIFIITISLFSFCFLRLNADTGSLFDKKYYLDKSINPSENEYVSQSSLSSSVSPLSALTEISEIESSCREQLERRRADSFLAESKIADYVDIEEFYETKLMFRIKAQETLSSYVFQNADGTKTVYMMADNVKYVDERGSVKEKDIHLASSDKGFEVKDSDVKLLFPKKLSEGVELNTTLGSFVLASKYNSDSIAEFDEETNSVKYAGVFGEKTFLRYTPSLSGVKEEIILEERPESNVFEFILKAPGLTLSKEDGLYYLAAAENKDQRIRFDQILIYDANCRFTAGSIIVSDEGYGTLLLTITAPVEFLDDPETVYPVTVDPSFKIKTDVNSANIIDAAVYDNQTDMNAGTWQYNNIGYTDSTYGLARTVVKLSGLLSNATYLAMTADQINSVLFSVKEATGNTSKTVKIHPLNGTPTWTETSVTWNNYGSYDTAVSYGGTLSGGQRTNFNITNLVKSWKNGSYNGNGCFIFIMGGTENSEHRAFCSTEHTGTDNRPYVKLTYTPSISLSSYSLNVIEGSSSSLLCTVLPAVGYHYVWEINHTDLATCSPVNSFYTTVNGVRSGQAELTVKVYDTADVYIDEVSAFIFVLKPDGVYKLINVDVSRPLECDGTVSDEITAKLSTVSYAGSDPDVDRIKVMWKIKHIIYGRYTIRPLYKPDTCLTSDSFNNAVSRCSGTLDTWDGTESDERWTIEWETGYYYCLSQYSSGTKRLTIRNNNQEDVNAVFVRNDTASNDRCQWILQPADNVPAGIYLYDLETGEVFDNTPVKYIAPDETRTFTDIGVIPVAYSGDVIDQSFIWSSGNTAKATVTSSGNVSGISSTGSGQVGISISWNCPQHTNVSNMYWMQVLEIPNGLYFLKNKKSGKYVDIQNQEMVDGKNIIQYSFHGYNSQRWVIKRSSGKYYTIKSANSHDSFYLSSFGNTYNDNVVLHTGNLVNGKLWEIKETSSGAYLISSKCSSATNQLYVMDIENGTNNNGGNVHQRLYSNDSNYRDEWIIETGYNTFFIDALYDYAYDYRFSDAETRISNTFSVLKQKYLEEFGIDIILNDCSLFFSYADNDDPYYYNNPCDHDTICENSFAYSNGTVVYKTFHHTNVYNILFRLPDPTFHNYGIMAFIGHITCRMRDTTSPSQHDNISPFAGLTYIEKRKHIIMWQLSIDDEIEAVVHEFGHLYGAIDHYGLDVSPTTLEVINTTGDNRFNPYCIYGEYKEDETVKSNLLICDGCRARIEAAVGDYN